MIYDAVLHIGLQIFLWLAMYGFYRVLRYAILDQEWYVTGVVVGFMVLTLYLILWSADIITLNLLGRRLLTLK